MSVKRLVLMGLFLVGMSISVSLRSADKKENPVPFFIRSIGATDDFTDASKDRSDSVKDLSKKIRDSKSLILAESESNALIVLEVLDRAKQDTYNDLWGAHNRSILAVRMHVGDFTTELTGNARGAMLTTAWGEAAKKIVKQVEEWVKANREKLKEIKK